MVYHLSTDERANFLYKKYGRAPSTTTASASVAGEATEVVARGAVASADEIYADPVPESVPVTDVSYEYVEGPPATVSVAGVPVDLAPSAADLAAAHGLTEDVWQAFKDGELGGAASVLGAPQICFLEDLALRHVTSTANIGASPAYYHPCLFDALPSTAYGNVYAVTVRGGSTVAGSETGVTVTSVDDGNWVLQPESGVLQFMDSTGSAGGVPMFDRSPDADAVALFNLHKTPRVSFYRYVGAMLDAHLQADLDLGSGADRGLRLGDDRDMQVYFDDGAGELVIETAGPLRTAAPAGALAIQSLRLRGAGGDDVDLEPYSDLGRSGVRVLDAAGGNVAGVGSPLGLRGDAGTGAAGVYDSNAGAWLVRAMGGAVEVTHAGAARITTTAGGASFEGGRLQADTVALETTVDGDHATADGEFRLAYNSALGLRGYHPVTGWHTYMDTANSSSFALDSSSVALGHATVESQLAGTTDTVVVSTSGTWEGLGTGNAALICDASTGGTAGLYDEGRDRWVVKWAAGTGTALYVNDVSDARVQCEAAQTTFTGDLQSAAADFTWSSVSIDGSLPVQATSSIYVSKEDSPYYNLAIHKNGAVKPYAFNFTVTDSLTYLVRLDGSAYLHSSANASSKSTAASGFITTTGVVCSLSLEIDGVVVAESAIVSRGTTNTHVPLMPLSAVVSLSAGTRSVDLWVTTNSGSTRYMSFFDVLFVAIPAGA